MIPIQNRYKKFCADTYRCVRGEWIAADTFKIAFVPQIPSRHTAVALFRAIPFMFRKAEHLIESKVDCVFKDDGFCYLTFITTPTPKHHEQKPQEKPLPNLLQ